MVCGERRETRYFLSGELREPIGRDFGISLVDLMVVRLWFVMVKGFHYARTKNITATIQRRELGQKENKGRKGT